MSKAKTRRQEQARAAFVATIVQAASTPPEPIEMSQRTADALADFILADAELRGDHPTLE